MRDQLAQLVNEAMAEDFAEIPGVTRAAMLRFAHAAARIGAELEREECVGVACELVDDDDSVNLQALAETIRARGGK